MYWKFTKTPEKPKTLVDAPEGVRCVVTRDGSPHWGELVRLRQGTVVHATLSEMQSECPEDYILIQILDLVPEQSAPKPVLDPPEGVCTIKPNSPECLLFHSAGKAWCHNIHTGAVSLLMAEFRDLPNNYVLPGITATLVQD